MKKSILIIFVFFGICLSGCATAREQIELRGDISDLQIKIKELQRNQADLSSKLDDMLARIGPLNSELKQTQDRMSYLAQRFDDMEVNLSNRMNKLYLKMSGTSIPAIPTPTELYNTGFSDYSAGKFDVAVQDFKSYLDKYPNSEMAPQAQYYLGESYFSLKDYINALKIFQLIGKNYPRSSMVSASMMQQGLTLEALNKKDDAAAVYKDIVKNYPNDPEAQAAKEKLGKEANAK